MRIKQIILLALLMCFSLTNVVASESELPEFSKAGYYEIKNSGRTVYNFNIGWRFYKGENEHAFKREFNDTDWGIVNCPHGLELISTESSGSNNYQGVAWYRKKFDVKQDLKGKLSKLYFEGVMGKCKVWLNGEFVAEHYGGYLPFVIDITDKIIHGEENIVALRVDNSDDPDYPPGKAQAQLDFTYFGGIYRDVWMLVTNPIYVTSPIEEDKVAGAGIFTHVNIDNQMNAQVLTKVDIKNEGKEKMKVKVDVVLKDENNLVVRKANKLLDLEGNYTATVSEEMEVVEPQLWSPWSPSLYNVEVTITDINNNPIDGVAVKIGLRKIEFKGKEGFFLNNEPYPGKLMGVNRHQDHAVVGNAMSNNSQWRDAKLLKDAGCDIVRAAHYPVDPAFMDACDALGLFYIVATPGWQFWNKKPIFEKRVLQDIRNMVRRDRNHPCVIMWEPILNETWYPESFAKKTHNAVHEEYPFQGAYTVCDAHARGQKNFDIIYSHPFKDEFFKNVKENTKDNRLKLSYDYAKEERCVFTREWGDCVDDWNSHNSPSRAARDWGERAQLTQAIHYSNSSYVYTNWESLHNTPSQHVGGTLWHSFDHQRGYHPDPFYGGITDDFRQPKYSYFMFASQKDVSNENLAMVYIAHEMTPFSEPDVTVFSNCEEVRLIIYEQDTIVKNVSNYNLKMPHPVVIFEDVFNFIDVKNLHRAKMQSKASLIAEGLIDGKVVTTFKRMPAKRPSKVVLSIENNNVPLLANGSDFVRVVASITDEDGNIKRLNESDIRFEIEGEGSLIGNSSTFTNPRKVRWGTAPILVQSSLSSGKIKVKASVVDEGINSPLAGELEFESLESSTPFIYKEVGKESYQEINISGDNQTNFEFQSKIKQLEKTINNYRLKEVERQQQEFEGGQNK